MSTTVTLAQASIHEIHNTIAHVFTRKNPADLIAIQTALHPDFHMVTTSGLQVDLMTVLGMFQSKQGCRPDLKIEVSNIVVLSQSDNMVWLQYQETHYEPTPTSRIACVCVLIENGQWQWRYLHETPMAA